ncbi:hypothetical protein SLS53_004473 [Cytospora paraplurivora]|uniref:lytic cellulose monooxygenase (C4-dehydrogenating) n=1 Tax=Cytospora paraplurivora TaxID=2898453 RepID=A0AAN9YH88_9PEZI
MSYFSTKGVAAAIICAASVAAHGHIKAINVAGTYYDGYDTGVDPYKSDPPTLVAWTASNTNEGFIAPSAYASSDIICHVDAKPAGGYATANAGDKVELYWTDWPATHKGPVIDYLAKCADDDCVNVDKTSLDFFKIDAVGLVSDSDAPDHLISNNNSWLIKIPSDLASGNYVLRHEIIALHSADESDGAQNYPQCFNLAITGTGSLKPTGTPGKSLYAESDAGIFLDIYKKLDGYEIPGPTQIADGTNLPQSSIAVKHRAAAVTDVRVASGAAAATTTAAAETGSAASKSAAHHGTTSSASSAAQTESVATAKVTSSAGESCKRRRHARDVLKA